jgi:replicative DNA helicase
VIAIGIGEAIQHGGHGILLWHTVGTGKCMAKDTPILMYDGSIKMIQDIRVGETLMGDDSRPRSVQSLARGIDNMFKVKQSEGDDYVVNHEHIFWLCMSI